MSQPLSLNYLWSRRSFLLSLVYKDLKAKYAHSLLGLTWIVVQPMLLVTALTVIFRFIGRDGLNAGNTAFPVFFFTGILPWNFFQKGLNDGCRCFVAEASIMRKYGFPREVLPMKDMILFLVEFLFSGLVLPVLLLVYHHPPTAAWIWLPPIVLIECVEVYGVILILGSLNVYIRDVEKFMSTSSTILFWLTPVIFRLRNGSDSSRMLHFNPAAGIIESFRMVLLDGKAPHPQYLFWPALWGVAFVGIGLMVFRKLERGFADVL